MQGEPNIQKYIRAKVSTLLRSEPIPRRLRDPDSVLFVDWQEIDASFTSYREYFRLLDSVRGPFKIIKRYPADTSILLATSRYYALDFEDYQNVDSVLTEAEKEEGLDLHFPGGAWLASKVGARRNEESLLQRGRRLQRENLTEPTNARLVSLTGVELFRFEFIPGRETRVPSSVPKGVYYLIFADGAFKLLLD